jgi:2-dehydro-3-deoxyphosphogluconate aldolase / (4S)-4-hydroxy-2-oxoglutarate aldolase
MPNLIDQTRDALLEEGVILCIRLDSAAGVVEGCQAALRGGLRVVELTLTTPGALDAMRVLSQDPAALVGAGTVLSPDDVKAVAQAGGRFVLSPVFDREVIDTAHTLGLLAIPGTATPTEILAAHRYGAKLVKVFPSGALGGPAYLRAVRGPLPDVPLIPTSGPTSENLAEYFAAGARAVGVGAEVITRGFTLGGVESAAARVRAAVRKARNSSH